MFPPWVAKTPRNLRPQGCPQLIRLSCMSSEGTPKRAAPHTHKVLVNFQVPGRGWTDLPFSGRVTQIAPSPKEEVTAGHSELRYGIQGAGSNPLSLHRKTP